VTIFEIEYKGIIGATQRERWDITRTRTKSYAYLGMDAATADECVKYLNAYWMRPYYDIGQWTYDVGTHFARPESKYKELVAKITSKRDDGGLYRVDVIVDEIMTLPTDANPNDYTIDALQNLFTSRIGLFTYDEDETIGK
jgi:hypothetical protein